MDLQKPAIARRQYVRGGRSASATARSIKRGSMSREMLTGNVAAAWGARLAEVDYVPAFPITPQTEIVETLSKWLHAGTMNGRYVSMDSEHAYPLDLIRKFEEARPFRGPKMFLASAPCPTGWHFDPARSNRYAKLEVDCCLFPLKKAINA
jgi:hypothetical protein